jgi:IPT/TIG domain
MRPMAAARRGGAPAGLALVWTLLGAAAGCAPGGQSALTVAQVMPASAYGDAPVAVAVFGENFRPTYQIDARTGSVGVDPAGFAATLANGSTGGPTVELQQVVWQSPDLLAAQIPPATRAGWYDLVVRDPRGSTSTLTRAFQALGTDTLAPLVRIASPAPNTLFAAGAAVPVVVVADDGYGTVTALEVVMSSGSGAEQTYTCAVTGQSAVSCPFTLPAPAPASVPDFLTITATATGSGGLMGQARAVYPLQLSPSVTTLSPTTGSTRGGTEVQIYGDRLVPGQTTVAFDGVPATIEDLSATSITALTPMHPSPGPVRITVTVAGVTLQSTFLFTYLASPLVRQVLPPSGAAAGGYPVTIVGDNFMASSTQINFGTTPLRCPTFVSANRIDGWAPPGAGTVAVSAVDSKSGSIPNATVPFYYLQDGGYAGPLPPDGMAGVSPDAGAADASAPDDGCPGGPS